MTLLCVGLSHHTAPVPLRERLALGVSLSAARSAGLLGGAAGQVDELVVLQTCHRTELYASDRGERLADGLAGFLAAAAELPAEVLAPHLYVWTDEEAARHLMAVAAGLDSLILGEAEILGQVRAAQAAALAAGTSGRRLGELFTAAVRTGRRARRETAIGRGAASVPSAAVALACAGLSASEMAERVVLVVGAGKMGLLAARALVDHGVRQVRVTNRSFERAEALARQWSGRAVPFEALPAALAEADQVITSTGAPHALITRAAVAEAMAARPDRPLVIVDIAVPRDVEPAAAEVPGVTLFGQEHLTGVMAGTFGERAAAVPAVEALVAEDARRFAARLAARQVDATVAALHRWAEAVREEELERHLRRLAELDSREQEVVRALSVALVGKLLHPPIAHLKNGGAGHAAAAQALFGLAPAPAPDPIGEAPPDAGGP